jgi:hypothetical protein
MRWLPLSLLAFACTHSQPNPAPLSVPAENAAGPANLPDGGPADGGAGDAGLQLPADGGTPRADAFIRPMTESGSATPLGLDWGEKGEQPAAALFKNVKVLGDATGNQVMAAMQSMRANLGGKCAMCHLVEQKDFGADVKKEKLRAREMMRMSEEINRKTFAGKTQVTCWMCHRGDEEPPKMDFSKELPKTFADMAAEQLARPAEQVFKDVRQLKGMDARNFGLLMGWFARELGVKCTHCHAAPDFAADTAKKTRAREMLQMVAYVADGYYQGNTPIGCGTCHRGKTTPARTAADKS